MLEGVAAKLDGFVKKRCVFGVTVVVYESI
jgi:hypothetical protein